MERKNGEKSLQITGLILLFLYFLLTLTATFPNVTNMFVDNAFYGYAGQQINTGHHLYTDVFDIKPPTVHYIYAFWLKLFPASRWSFVLLDALTTLGLLTLLFLTMRNLGITRVYGAAGILFLTCYRVYRAFSGGNLNEHFYLLFFFAALFLLTSPPHRVRGFLLGFLAGPLLMLKQTFIPFTFALYFFYGGSLLPQKKYILPGCIAAFVLYAVILIPVFGQAMDAMIFAPLAMAGSLQAQQYTGFDGLVYRLSIFQMCGPAKETLLVLLPALFVKNRLRILFVLTLVFALAILLFSPLLYAHYLLIFTIPVLLGAFLIAKGYPTRIAWAFLILMALMPISRIIGTTVRFSTAAVGKILSAHALGQEVDQSVLPAMRHLKTGDTLVMVGDYIPEIYFYTKTRSPFRHIFFGFNTAEYYRDELAASMREHPPDYLLLRAPETELTRLFQLSPSMYTLTPVDGDLYRFSLRH